MKSSDAEEGERVSWITSELIGLGAKIVYFDSSSVLDIEN